MTTIKDIADLAGVSRGTVDRVLNSRGAVSPQTAEKVLEIARALGYRPNKAILFLMKLWKEFAQKPKNFRITASPPLQDEWNLMRTPSFSLWKNCRLRASMV